MKKHNFSAGPAILPASVLEEAARGVLNINDSGLSILEISHRSKDFIAIAAQAEQLVRELLNLSDDYAVMFLSGGASTQFFMAPMNLLNEDETACYVNTGSWADKAAKEAKNFGKIETLASSKEQNYTFIPRGWEVPAYAKYLHLTSNNTIYGTQFHWWPDTEVPIVCDMSSDMFSRTIPVEKFGLIYAGAQKNMGPAGTTLVIVRKDLLGKVKRTLPSMLNYTTHIDNDSMYNTPPVYAIYVSMLTMKWIKEQGGLTAIEAHNQAKGDLFYHELDANPLFHGTVTVKEDRSLMNPTFLAINEEVDKAFDAAAKAAGIDGIRGHRSVGGFRASMYNAMPLEGVQVLVDVMKDIAQKMG
ncbi:3-phosphoserine/phosphohydroxythreonine transaminase [Haliscomenobacter hydrossis]|uniref:Phosphoserine aminotransferase n=1 Tax=Haliscomenobacter hydrossis (strain ATCC 27775 / DSM 1100 / LMG 10767 / O) TaxID=760192 RepID=F4KWK8_HALH1|nr:3-phosphoserine/phosphohydroxythreonine transaminase [Haliscomenobacter hydrossis]AEE51348.1 Phosphoserine aminotransferase [Haliscomenobacter hydrossis DSM 1100]